ncbi:MAG: GH39 family glycosyl hydrolase [Gemmatimonadota bacterium]
MLAYGAVVSPPRDWDRWSDLIRDLVTHWTERYGLAEVRDHWSFEVWNEPNLDVFWSGTREEYFRLYDVTASAVRSVNPDLRIGGPASAASEWVDELLATWRPPARRWTSSRFPTDSRPNPPWNSSPGGPSSGHELAVGIDGDGAWGLVEALAARDDDGRITLLVWNAPLDQHAPPRGPAAGPERTAAGAGAGRRGLPGDPSPDRRGPFEHRAGLGPGAARLPVAR